MNQRDRNNMGYMQGGMMPQGNMGPGMNPNQPMPLPAYPNGNMGMDLEQRLNRIERSLRRLVARVNRLESPYPEATPYQSQDNNNMYMI